MAPQLEGVQFAVPCYLACALWRMSARGGRLGSSLASYQGGSSSTRSGRYRWAAVCGSRAAMICGQRQASKQRGGSAEASIIMVATCQTCPRGTPPPPPPHPPTHPDTPTPTPTNTHPAPPQLACTPELCTCEHPPAVARQRPRPGPRLHRGMRLRHQPWHLGISCKNHKNKPQHTQQ